MNHKFFFFLLMSVFIAVEADAAYITLAPEYQIHKSDNNLILDLKSRNKGDEAAVNVQFKVSIGDQEQSTALSEEVGIGQEVVHQLVFDQKFSLPGRYPVLIKTYYQDTNNYQFTSLLCGSYDHNKIAISDVLVKGTTLDLPINKSGDIKFMIRNNTKNKHDLQLKLYTPDELLADDGTKTISLEPDKEETVLFKLKNYSALQNSSYAIFLVTQYESEGIHYTASSPGNVRIVASKSNLPPVWMMIAAIAIFAFVFIVKQFKKK